MKFTQKNMVFIIVFLMGTLFNYHSFFQHSNHSVAMEYSSENNSTSDSFFSDSEAYEDELISSKKEIPSFVGINKTPNYFQVTYLLTRPLLSVWQPPKNN